MFETGSVILLCGIIFAVIISIYYRQQYLDILSKKKSSEVRLGQTAEHLVPFLRHFPYDPKKAHFIGMPIDYIIFEEDRIIFLEVKTGSAQLNLTQQRIKKLVAEGRVTWAEFRISADSATEQDKLTAFKALEKAGVTLR